MTFRSLTCIALLFALAGVAQAHTHLTKSMPEDKSVLTSPPSQLMLNFSEATRLTALTLQKEGDKEASKLGPLPKEAAADFTLPLQPLPPGAYTINWRVVGDDNHIMNGVLHFVVKSDK